MDLRLT